MVDISLADGVINQLITGRPHPVWDNGHNEFIMIYHMKKIWDNNGSWIYRGISWIYDISSI
jgi:hypothetical protein